MEIKCWGSRGSIPVSGNQYLKYGGDTTCIEIISKTGDIIIVDAGTGIRRLGNSLLKRKLCRYYLLFTHAHWDHILGIAFFRPLQFSNVCISIQDRMFSDVTTKDVLTEVMKTPFFPIGLGGLNADIRFDKTLNTSFSIGPIQVETIALNHTGGGLGYKFMEDGKTFVFLTDNELGFRHSKGLGFNDYLDFAKNADLLFHDGEYTRDEYMDKKSWGHSSIPDVINLAVNANVKKLGLFHLNQDRTDAHMDQIVAECAKDLKKHKSCLDCFAVACNMSVIL